MNEIHPSVVIEGDVQLGRGNRILPYCVLTGPLRLGDDNVVGPHVVLGSPGQNTRDPRYDTSGKRVEIGSRNIIREFTAVQKPCFTDLTRVGNGVFMMQGVHVPHDASIEDDVVLTPTVVLGGTTSLMRGANLGLGVMVHQNSVIGAWAMIAAGATVVKNVRPFAKFIPGRPLGVNDYAVTKFGFAAHREEIEGFVLRDELPSSAAVRDVVERYQELHRASKRAEYR